jgi:hypothetical protein
VILAGAAGITLAAAAIALGTRRGRRAVDHALESWTPRPPRPRVVLPVVFGPPLVMSGVSAAAPGLYATVAVTGVILGGWLAVMVVVLMAMTLNNVRLTRSLLGRS